MPGIYPPPKAKPSDPSFFTINPLPQLLQTPSGLALLELQGKINLPQVQHNEDGSVKPDQEDQTRIGRLVFPNYNPNVLDPNDKSWMKVVFLYIGQHQRLAGEVKKLPKAVAVMRRREKPTEAMNMIDTEGSYVQGEELPPEELEIADIVKYKLVFSQRPEPVGT